MKPYYLYRQKNMSGNLENVGYATEGHFGLYNILIMEEKQTIMALGAGTISKAVHPDGLIERCENVKEVALYLEKIDEMIERENFWERPNKGGKGNAGGYAACAGWMRPVPSCTGWKKSVKSVHVLMEMHSRCAAE